MKLLDSKLPGGALDTMQRQEIFALPFPEFHV
jgi:hypothetical protein